MNQPEFAYCKSLLMMDFQRQYHNLYYSPKYSGISLKKWKGLKKQCENNLLVLYKSLNNSNEILRTEIYQSKMNKQ